MLYPIYKGTYERITAISDQDPVQVRDGTIAVSKDLGRSIDYLETRKDVDIQKLAYLGVSWGAETAPMLLAAESRIRTAVLLSGGLASFFGALPEINTVNFLWAGEDSDPDGERPIRYHSAAGNGAGADVSSLGSNCCKQEICDCCERTPDQHT